MANKKYLLRATNGTAVNLLLVDNGDGTYSISVSGGGGGGGGGATTIADGADVAQGAKADAAWDGSVGAFTVVAILKYVGAKIEALRALVAATLAVGGNVASGAADSGNPVKVGGKYNSAAPTLANGNRGDFQLDVNGNLKVAQQAAGVAGEAHIGAVGGYSPLIVVTPVLDTSVYAAGDVMFVATSIANAMRVNDGTGLLQTIYAIDKSDQAALALDLYFFDAAVAFGTINTVPTITDADAANYLGHISIAAADWKDLGGAKVAQLVNLGKHMKPVSGARNLYVAGVIQAAATFAASDLVLRFGLLDD